ncbi:hypothetical protein [Spongiimicrobium salis]|uniref:hypothetical protein n=1 Tax=Spongiimicrobium salis TaxID=1667022 RepID=UPI00374CE6A6
MESEKPQHNTSDEIDLGQSFELFKKGLDWVFNGFLKFVLFLKRNSIKIGILLVVGLLTGYGLKKIQKNNFIAEVIVTPNLASKAYLYDVINEISENIRTKDTAFVAALGIELEHLDSFDIEIQPVGNTKTEASRNSLEYMKILANYESNGIIPEIIQTEVLNVSDLSHRIIFFSTNKKKLPEYSRKILDYINSNTYYDQLIKAYNDNSRKRIALNEVTLQQIDELIRNFSKNMSSSDTNNQTGRIVLGDDEELNISELLQLKNSLIKDNEGNLLELKRRVDPVTVVNIGKPYRNRTSFFSSTIFLIPVIFLSLFFLGSIMRIIGNKAKEIENNEREQ